MKLKLSFLVMSVMLFLASCSSNDTDNNVVSATDVAGTYNGYSVATCTYFTKAENDESVIITSKGNDKCDISFTSKSWGNSLISNATVSFTNNTFTIVGNGNTSMGMNSTSVKDYDCTFKGTISEDKKTVSLKFEVPNVMGGLTITFTLEEPAPKLYVARKYTGILDLSVAGDSITSIKGSKVTITTQTDNNVKVVLAGFGYSTMALNDISIPDVTVTRVAKNSFKLAGNINTTSGTSTVTGKLEGTVNDTIANLTFTMKPGAMPMNIVGVFSNKTK